MKNTNECMTVCENSNNEEMPDVFQRFYQAWNSQDPEAEILLWDVLKAMQGEEFKTAKGKLGTFGASYLYPVFQKAGIIRKPE